MKTKNNLLLFAVLLFVVSAFANPPATSNQADEASFMDKQWLMVSKVSGGVFSGEEKVEIAPADRKDHTALFHSNGTYEITLNGERYRGKFEYKIEDGKEKVILDGELEWLVKYTSQSLTIIEVAGTSHTVMKFEKA